ncbi:MAG: IS21 family transposase [Deltaproteobacteria bacterium]|nr:IS21 family transposase [Deltaproteobacteria bacterium]MBF0524030.1 IS21 family transposase [Deltaproteobacteria bacterium]
MKTTSHFLGEAMIDRRTVFEIHRLYDIGYSVRKIAGTLQVNRKIVDKYLKHPDISKNSSKRVSKLQPFEEEISRLLNIDPKASAVVIRQRLAELGFDGGITILKDYLQRIRPSAKKQAFIRFESAPGEQCQIDWGHFGSLDYEGHKRKLYCLAVIECHSRMLYLEFTHAQTQDTLHSCLLNAFRFYGGSPKELVHDNMLTAVLEREGSLIRFNEAFLDFLRPFKITPKACHVRQPQEKGKVEKGAIHYIRKNFWPLRSFKDLTDIHRQANRWRDEVANVRIHNTTGQRPIDRFEPEALKPLPEFLPDCRELAVLKVHTDFSIRFGGNNYTVPPYAVGKMVTAKADHQTLTIYDHDKPIASHPRSWKRRQRIELPAHHEAAKKQKYRQWTSEEVAVFISLGEEAKTYLECLAEANQPIKQNVRKLLRLKDDYGVYSLMTAIKRASLHHAYGAHYVENILYQEMTPQRLQPPVKLKQEQLNQIRLEEPSLADYDSLVLKRRKRHDRD